MDATPLLADLNPAQREAVTAGSGPLLVLAGAGSGKTRVLTHRVAWLVGVEGASPHAVLAVTFTNKAAAEMRARIERLLQQPVRGMWVGTFHGLSHRLLRAHWQEAGLLQSFQILDAEDQYRLIRRVLKGLNLDEGYWPPRQAAWFINGHKEEGRRPAQLGQPADATQQQWVRVYAAYEATCHRSGVVDFAELLLRSYELLRDREALRAHYQDRFRHVLVDEFQDTNRIQYRWLELFAAAHKNLFVVGDDDQSIYGWRGACVENILKFEADHPGTRTVRLEQNYRSTGNILKAANQVIAHNQGRLGKQLWTADPEGEPILLYGAYTDLDEAQFVVSRIQDWAAHGRRRAEVAVLYRSNAQSRVLEEKLFQAGVPYRVYGGLRFFERREIKDALAYLRLMVSRHDDPSFERVANVPTRGLGAKTLDALREHARSGNVSLWEAARKLLAEATLPATPGMAEAGQRREQLPVRAANALKGFLELIERLARETQDSILAGKVEHMLALSGLVEHHKKEKGEKAESRVENLEELVSAARGFADGNEGWPGRGFEHDESDGFDPLSAFLAHAALEAGEGEADPWADCVQLMSLHSAKGLEFPLVFLTGLEEGLFPHQRALEEPGRLEEERRLCYVGMTRARERLVLSHAEVRRLHGQEHYTRPSRFLEEMPSDLIQEVRVSGSAARTPASSGATPAGGGIGSSRPLPGGARRAGDKHRPAAGAPFGGAAARGTPEEAAMRLGCRVRHETFGEGVVLHCEGQGSHARVQVNFEAVGTKWLVLGYARLQTL